MLRNHDDLADFENRHICPQLHKKNQIDIF